MEKIAEEFKTEIARKIVLYVQEVYTRVFNNFKDNPKMKEIQLLNQQAMLYANSPLGQPMDKLVKVLRGNDGYLYHLFTFIAFFAQPELNNFFSLAKRAIDDAFTEQTRLDVYNNRVTTESTRARLDITDGILFLEYI